MFFFPEKCIRVCTTAFVLLLDQAGYSQTESGGARAFSTRSPPFFPHASTNIHNPTHTHNTHAHSRVHVSNALLCYDSSTAAPITAVAGRKAMALAYYLKIEGKKSHAQARRSRFPLLRELVHWPVFRQGSACCRRKW